MKNSFEELTASRKMDVRETIAERAHQLGFSLIGFTPAEPVAGAVFYAHWLSLGFAGEMSYMERNQDKRANPASMVAGAKTVVCLGMHYYQETPPPTSLSGNIACYARGDDYHDLIKKRVSILWDFIRAAADEPVVGRICVDTAPVLERELAQRAGLGWWGKNTCLINKREGSYFFLAEIIMDLELPYDQPATDHCGTCTRCLDACPTNAFPEPYVLDANRCISYLTIELKGAIPHELRDNMGNWIFGCDICQDVCPWNRRVETATETGYIARPEFNEPPLHQWIELNTEAFREKFHNNPIKRSKRRGLLRNIAVALGNSGCEEAIPALEHALEDAEPLVRGHAAWALGRLGGQQAISALNKRLEHEENPDVLEEIKAALLFVEERLNVLPPVELPQILQSLTNTNEL